MSGKKQSAVGRKKKDSEGIRNKRLTSMIRIMIMIMIRKRKKGGRVKKETLYVIT